MRLLMLAIPGYSPHDKDALEMVLYIRQIKELACYLVLLSCWYNLFLFSLISTIAVIGIFIGVTGY